MGSLRYFSLPKRALVLSNIQAWEAAVAVSGPGEEEYVASNRFLAYAPIDGRQASVNYLLHYFLSDSGIAALRRASPGTQVRNRTLGQRLFEDIEVPLPEVADQYRIAEYLDGIRDKVRQVESLRMDHWKPIEAALQQLPWENRMSDLMFEDYEEVELKQEETYRQIGVFGHGRGIIDRGTFVGADTKYTRMLRVRSGQVVLSRLKAFEGAVAVAGIQHDGALASKEFPTFTVKSDVDPLFVQAILASPALEGRLRAESTGLGARRERVDAQRFLSIKVPLPSPDTQKRLGKAANRSMRIRFQQNRADQVSSALLPSARNDIFNSLR